MLAKIKASQDSINALLKANIPISVVEQLIGSTVEIENPTCPTIKCSFAGFENAEWVLPSSCIEILAPSAERHETPT
jgi:hypothetical protein